MIDDEADAPLSGDGGAGTEEKVGYGQPPKATRFKPGQSGNLRGRPKGARGHKAIVEEIAGELHRVTEGGTTRWCSTLELILLSLRNRAAAADVRAFKAYSDLQARFGTQEPKRQGGCIIVPERLTEEEWEAQYSPKDEPVG
jgi:Family of unknown function (DUF5681)